MARIGIIDYGLGNLRSVAGAVERLGHEALVSAGPDELAACDKLILPGVGAFGDGMKNLRARSLVDPLTKMVGSGKPILGICLGFHLIAEESEEFGVHEGLGWIPARVKKMHPADESIRIPHVGWNNLEQTAESPLYKDVPEDALFYYVHSFQLVPNAELSNGEDIVIGRADHGGSFVSAIASNNIFAVQFHPEKSQRHGLKLLENYLIQA